MAGYEWAVLLEDGWHAGPPVDKRDGARGPYLPAPSARRKESTYRVEGWRNAGSTTLAEARFRLGRWMVRYRADGKLQPWIWEHTIKRSATAARAFTGCLIDVKIWEQG